MGTVAIFDDKDCCFNMVNQMIASREKREQKCREKGQWFDPKQGDSMLVYENSVIDCRPLQEREDRKGRQIRMGKDKRPEFLTLGVNMPSLQAAMKLERASALFVPS